jgi:hypothetical protein
MGAKAGGEVVHGARSRRGEWEANASSRGQESFGEWRVGTSRSEADEWRIGPHVSRWQDAVVRAKRDGSGGLDPRGR